ncbi:MAG: glutamate dehydrogenase, partial [Sphaerochaeta sp.]|nr:glutamate dehydrogenase [Sphaerochaeta sp.]
MYSVDALMEELERKNPAQPEFIQAVKEVLESVIDVVNDNPVYEKHRILERMTEPDRIYTFRV